MKAFARLALALIAVIGISACVFEDGDGGHWHGERGEHYHDR
jgi:hypothetical protein